MIKFIVALSPARVIDQTQAPIKINFLLSLIGGATSGQGGVIAHESR